MVGLNQAVVLALGTLGATATVGVFGLFWATYKLLVDHERALHGDDATDYAGVVDIALENREVLEEEDLR